MGCLYSHHVNILVTAKTKAQTKSLVLDISQLKWSQDALELIKYVKKWQS